MHIPCLWAIVNKHVVFVWRKTKVYKKKSYFHYSSDQNNLNISYAIATSSLPKRTWRHNKCERLYGWCYGLDAPSYLVGLFYLYSFVLNCCISYTLRIFLFLLSVLWHWRYRCCMPAIVYTLVYTHACTCTHYELVDLSTSLPLKPLVETVGVSISIVFMAVNR